MRGSIAALDQALKDLPQDGAKAVRDILVAGDFPGYLTAAQVAVLTQRLHVSVPQLMMMLLPAAARYAVAAISDFHVGAIALGRSGGLYFGGNIEFTGEALSFVVHAEQAAITNAWLHGECEVSSLAISAAPCGYCRQFLYELVTASTLTILLPKAAPALLTTYLPNAFGPQDLGVTGGLMTPQNHGLVLEVPSDDPLLAAALAAANASYAPYTGGFAGAALRLSDGTILTGRYAENAAYNPSMSPLESAITALVLSGRSYGEISEAALVEQRSKTSQVDAARAVLGSVCTAPLAVAFATPG